MKLMRVKDWAKYYENNRTRELKTLTWVPIPNRHDGDGYTELVDHPNGAAHLGAWLAILQVASRCDVRGTLLRDGARPYDSLSLARITRIPLAIFEEAIPRLMSIHWLEYIETKAEPTQPVTSIPQDDAAIPHEDATSPHEGALNGMEGNGMEGKGKSGRFTPPSLTDVRAYMTELELPPIEAEKFIAHYESNGWRVGKNKMQRWRSSCQTWKHRYLENHPQAQQPPAPEFPPVTEDDIRIFSEGVKNAK